MSVCDLDHASDDVAGDDVATTVGTHEPDETITRLNDKLDASCAQCSFLLDAEVAVRLSFTPASVAHRPTHTGAIGAQIEIREWLRLVAASADHVGGGIGRLPLGSSPTTISTTLSWERRWFWRRWFWRRWCCPLDGRIATRREEPALSLPAHGVFEISRHEPSHRHRARSKMCGDHRCANEREDCVSGDFQLGSAHDGIHCCIGFDDIACRAMTRGLQVHAWV